MNIADDARILALGGLLSAGVALLHFAVIFFSGVSLVIGVAYLEGTRRIWRTLQ